MTASLTVCRTAANTLSAGVTRDFCVAGHLVGSTTEALTQTPVRDAGTFKNLFIMVSANATTASTTWKLRKSGADTAVAATITAGATGGMSFFGTSESFADTDEMSYRCVAGTGGSITTRSVSIQFEPTNKADCITFLVARGLFSMTNNSDNGYFLPNGYIDSLVYVSGTRNFTCRAAGKIRDMAMYISANARTTTTNLRMMVNGSPVGVNLTIAGLTTGAVEDTSSEVAIAVNDTITWRITTGTGSGETITVAFASCTFASTRHEFLMIAGHGSGASFNANTQTYVSPAGRLFGETNEDQAELGFDGAQYCDFNFRVRDWDILTGSNTLDSTVDLWLRHDRVNVAKNRILATDDDVVKNVAGVNATLLGGASTFSHFMDLDLATSGSLGVIYISSVWCVWKAPPPRRSQRRYFQRSR